MRGYRVRFHLAQGEHFMHWQVKNLDTGVVSYYNPDKFHLVMSSCTLKNSRATAEKIHAGQNKSVCAWINAKHVTAVSLRYPDPIEAENRVSYNPRIAPYWTDSEGRNIDGMSFSLLETSGKTVGMVKLVKNVC